MKILNKDMPTTWTNYEAYKHIRKLQKVVTKLEKKIERLDNQDHFNSQRLDELEMARRPRFRNINTDKLIRIALTACAVAGTIKYICG